LSNDISTSRATVMNYIKYLKDARLLNMLYDDGEEFPKKPALVYMHNTNLMYPVSDETIQRKTLIETFFYNMLHKDHRLNKGKKNASFLVDRKYNFTIDVDFPKKNDPGMYYIVDKISGNEKNVIPAWLFGFLY
jgi:predicted AAA+ superfamily ATPase